MRDKLRHLVAAGVGNLGEPLSSTIPRRLFRRGVVASVLVGAAVLQALPLLDTRSLAAGDIWEAVLITTEFCVALCLVVDVRPPAVWVVCIGLFCMFSLVALWKYVHGAPNCGSMGALWIPPGRMVIVDLKLLAVLSVERPVAGRRPIRLRAGAMGGVVLVAGWVVVITPQEGSGTW